MPIIKLNAIPSTNDFLREMATSGALEPFTVAVAHSQTKGRGQTGSAWVSDPGKNLTFSIYVLGAVADASLLPLLGASVAVAVADALEDFGVPRIAVKWPNDILSGNRKLGGILIENSIGERIDSVIGIGLNVNQTDFLALPSATSVILETGSASDLDQLLDCILESIQRNLREMQPESSWEKYHRKLFMRGKAAMFAMPDKSRFMAVVRGVGRDGRLELEMADGSLQRFGLREVSMVY